jgi:RNA polymerase sigma factor (sigma-70 family)
MSDDLRGREWSTDPVEIIRAVYPQLLRTARRLVPTTQEAEDLVQEALVRTLVLHPELEGIPHPLGYLRTVLWRIAAAKRARKEIPLELSELMERSAPDLVEASAIVEGLTALPRRQRACVALRYLHGFDDETIARILGTKTSTVRSQTARGLARLRDVMEVANDANG